MQTVKIRILPLVLAALMIQAATSTAEAGFLRRTLGRTAIGIGMAAGSIAAINHAAKCSKNLDACPGTKYVAKKIVEAVENKLVPAGHNQPLLNKQYKEPPRTDSLPGFPGSKITRPKTPYPGGMRRRWNLEKGGFADWDYQHGELEVYDKQGNHKGSFNPDTAKQTKPAIKGRKAPK